MMASVLSRGVCGLVRAALALAVATSAAGCAKQTAVVHFPTLEALRRIAALPAPPPRAMAAAAQAADWTVDTSQAARTSDEPWQPSEEWGRAFQQELSQAGRPLRLSRALSCVARELGRYHRETQHEAPLAIRTFARGACGAVVPRSGTLSLIRRVAADVSDETLRASWRAELRAQLVAKLPADASEVGFWFDRHGDQALATVAYAQAAHDIKSFSLVAPDNGMVTFEGRLRDQVAHVGGQINQGRFGVAKCLVDPGVAPPQFRIVCPMAPDDRTAWVQLSYARPKRVLMSLFLEALVRRSERETLTHSEPAASEPSGTSEKLGFSQAVLAELNSVRSQANLGPVALAEAQSATASRVAAHYFAATRSDDQDALQDEIALGLLAGWEVAGMIRGGSFFSKLSPRQHAPTHWLHSALALPSGRATLLAPDIEQVALGTQELGQQSGMGALITGYRLHHGTDHSADVARLLSRLIFARQGAGFAAPSALSSVQSVLDQELQHLHSGDREPRAALREVLKYASWQYGQAVAGYILRTTSLDALQIPPEVLHRPQLQVAIGITHHKPVGAAWAQYDIFVIYLNSAPPGV